MTVAGIMPSYTEQAVIVRQDRTRRAIRAAIESAELSQSHAVESHSDVDGAYVNPELIRGAGIVTPPGMIRHHRPWSSLHAGRSSWARVTTRDAHAPTETLAQINGVGFAVGVFGEPFCVIVNGRRVATVRVTAPDGSVSYRTVGSYRRARETTRRAARLTTSAAPLTDVQRLVREPTERDLQEIEALAAGTA